MKASISPNMGSAPTTIDEVHLRGTAWGRRGNLPAHFYAALQHFLLVQDGNTSHYSVTAVRRPP